MDITENIAGLGKDHDESAQENDIAKKQSDGKPAAENIDMMPNSVSKSGEKKFDDEPEDHDKKNLHQTASEYAKSEHTKASSWENTAD